MRRQDIVIGDYSCIWEIGESSGITLSLEIEVEGIIIEIRRGIIGVKRHNER
jgi:hypothetical protein